MTTTTHGHPHNPPHPHHHTTKESVKETLISIIIAFILAFVFRSFVVEAFIIPTGSMAPTLMGAHMRFVDEQSGENWAVGPRDYVNGSPLNDALPLQGMPAAGRSGPVAHPIHVHEPTTGAPVEQENVPRRAGDRILVLKFLYMLQDPAPFDVVVFKNPGTPLVNYIKRLVGRPGEQIALADGDIFTRPVELAQPNEGGDIWSQPGWAIRRKPARVQKAVWQPVYDTARAPADPSRLPMTFVQPWVGTEIGGGKGSWTIGPADRVLRYAGKGAARLDWNTGAPWISGYSDPLSRNQIESARSREITDRYPYNEGTQQGPVNSFPVSDIRLRCAVRFDDGMDATQARVAAAIEARGHEFVGEVTGGKARVKLRSMGNGGARAGEWTVLAEVDAPAIAPGAPMDFEFWHADQALSVWLDGSMIVEGQYDWGPAERVGHATGMPFEQALRTPTRYTANPLADPALYRKPQAHFEIAGGAFNLSRVGLDRDLFYLPAYRANMPARATHPSTTMTLGPDQFFVCGDNSPSSEDARLWRDPDPWVAQQIDETSGIVPRKLILGKAFFVYFPALAGTDPIPMPDFGRMRFIQ